MRVGVRRGGTAPGPRPFSSPTFQVEELGEGGIETLGGLVVAPVPGGVMECQVVGLGPASKNGLLGHEAVPTLRRGLMHLVVGAFGGVGPGLVVVVLHFFIFKMSGVRGILRRE